MDKDLFYNFFLRIQLQNIVRRSSTPEEQKIIDEKRVALVAMFAELRDLQTAAGVIDNSSNEKPILDNKLEYDKYDEPTIQTPSVLSGIPVERKVIILPSNGVNLDDIKQSSAS